MVRFVLMVVTAAVASLGATSPRYKRQQAIYLPSRGSHFTCVRIRLFADFLREEFVTYHLITSLEARVSHLSDRVLLMECLLDRDDRGVRGEREVDTRETDGTGRVRDRRGIPEPQLTERGWSGTH